SISIKLSDDNKSNKSEKYKFKFFPSDTKDDIHHEISKAFSVESFSLVDDKEGHIITGNWDSLEDKAEYNIINRDNNSNAKRNRLSLDNDNRRIGSDH
ncbi:2544_t:CDS:1, partial [Scutellospora calospora]